MKKLLFLIGMMVFAVVTMAQKVEYTFPNDTITDGETIYLTYPKAISIDTHVAFAFTLTEVSGAATAITAILQESIQAGKWADNGTAVTLVTTGAPNEVSYVFKLTSTPCYNYRVKIVQTGTAVTKVLGSKFLKK